MKAKGFNVSSAARIAKLFWIAPVAVVLTAYGCAGIAQDGPVIST